MPTHSTRRLSFVALLSVIAIVLATLTSGSPANALSGSSFNAGNIISDYNFYNGAALSQAEIQSFLNNAEPSCTVGYTCLKSYSQTTYTRAADAMCAQYIGSANQSSAAIIYQVGQACGISQKVLLVLLEKEEGLVSSVAPSQSRYNTATGYACPDTSGCDTAYYGFYNQVYMAAWQFKRYGNPPGTTNYFTWHPVGASSSVAFNPVTSCGSTQVLIQDRATAALYYYTPYQPDAAALANLSGTGDSCSAYGNRNFWVYYTTWFGSTLGGAPLVGSFDTATYSATSVNLTGWAIDPTSPTAAISVQIVFTSSQGITSTQTVVANSNRPDVGAAYPLAGSAHGFVVSYPSAGSGQYSACLTAIPAPGNTFGNASLGCRTVFYSASIGGAPAVSRVSGPDRYGTAAAISRSKFNPGVPVVYIATGTNFADAMSAAPAAARQGGPLLLTDPNSLPPATLTELERLTPQKIVVVGGVSAVSAAVYDQLQTIQPAITRVSGSDRFETSRLIDQEAFGSASKVYIATGDNYPDALSASAAAGASDEPVVLIDGSESQLDSVTTDFLLAQKITGATVVGGTSAVTAGIQNGLQNLGIAVTRLGGVDRYATSSLINRAAFQSSSSVYLATGASYPDALAGAAIAGATNSPLYVVPGTCLPRADATDMVALGVRNVILLGGNDALTDDVAQLVPCP